jgi:hypothetical protein
MSGALINEIGHNPEVLTETEHERLTECLRAIRAHGKLSEVMRSLFVLQTDDGDTKRQPAQIIDWLASQYLEESRDADDEIGILIRCFDGNRHSSDDTAMWHVNEREFRVLRNVLHVMHADGWFPGWLQLQLTLMTDGKTPAERFPSPQAVMGLLAREIEEYDVQSRIAHTFAEQRPDLLFPAPPLEPEAASESEVAPGPEKRNRTRKRGRKAA